MSALARTLFIAEPPAQYLVLTPVVVDCSTLAGLVFEEHWKQQALDRIQGKTLYAPYLLQVEMASVAVKKHQQGRPDLATEGLAQFRAMNITLYQIEPVGALTLAIQYQLSAYDAAYLWLAAELKCPLATFDEKLGTAAQAHLATLP